MNNPWLDLPDDPPYVLEQDSPAFKTFNDKAAENVTIRLDGIPQPYLGNPTAPVVLLLLNPRSPKASQESPVIDSALKQKLLANLRHEDTEYPLLGLDPELVKPDGYWSSYLRELISDCTPQTVARSIFVIEYFPYFSYSYGFPYGVPSQRYNWHLVQQAMDRGAQIVQGRSRSVWLRVVPELFSYPNYHQLNSPRAPYLTPGNCHAYDEIVEAIQGEQ